MNTFITELRIAHTVYTAHAAGAETIGQIAHRTGLSVTIVADWAKLFRLKMQSPQRPFIRRASLQRRDVEKLSFEI